MWMWGSPGLGGSDWTARGTQGHSKGIRGNWETWQGCKIQEISWECGRAMERDRGHSAALKWGGHLGTWRHTGATAQP